MSHKYDEDDPFRASMYAGALCALILCVIILPVWFEDWLFGQQEWHFWVVMIPSWLICWVGWYSLLNG